MSCGELGYIWVIGTHGIWTYRYPKRTSRDRVIMKCEGEGVEEGRRSERWEGKEGEEEEEEEEKGVCYWLG